VAEIGGLILQIQADERTPSAELVRRAFVRPCEPTLRIDPERTTMLNTLRGHCALVTGFTNGSIGDGHTVNRQTHMQGGGLMASTSTTYGRVTSSRPKLFAQAVEQRTAVSEPLEPRGSDGLTDRERRDSLEQFRHGVGRRDRGASQPASVTPLRPVKRRPR